MKRILLTTTALTALAGAAFAQEEAMMKETKKVTISGDVNVKSISGGEVEANAKAEEPRVVTDPRFDWGMDINVTGTAELNNGVTASASVELDVIDDELGSDEAGISDFVLSLKSDQGGFYFGDTESAAVKQWAAVGDMEADDFSAQDGGAGEVYLRADVNVGGFAISIGQLIGEKATDDTNIPTITIINDSGTETVQTGTDAGTYDAANAGMEQLSLGAKGAVGPATLSLAYQEESVAMDGTSDYNPNGVTGVSASIGVAGATVGLGYAKQTVPNSDVSGTSTGLSVDYVAGPVTAGAYFVSESASGAGIATPKDNSGFTAKYVAGPITVDAKVTDEQGSADNEVDVSYAMPNGLTIIAGASSGEGSDEGVYVGGKYDLGHGATLEVVNVSADNANYDADDSTPHTDEYFDGDYALGTTVSVSFSF